MRNHLEDCKIGMMMVTHMTEMARVPHCSSVEQTHKKVELEGYRKVGAPLPRKMVEMEGYKMIELELEPRS